MDLVQAFKVDLVHRGVQKVARVRGKAVAGGGEGLWRPWRAEKAVAGGGEGPKRPWQEGETVAGAGAGDGSFGSYLMVTRVAPMGPMM